jgi:hypothetical protein
MVRAEAAIRRSTFSRLSRIVQSYVVLRVVQCVSRHAVFGPRTRERDNTHPTASVLIAKTAECGSKDQYQRSKSRERVEPFCLTHISSSSQSGFGSHVRRMRNSVLDITKEQAGTVMIEELDVRVTTVGSVQTLYKG